MATALFALLVVSWSVRGHCPMPVGASPASPAPHACHEPAEGLKSQSPPCCHAELSVDPPATTKKFAADPALAGVLGTWPLPPVALSVRIAHPRLPLVGGSGPPVLSLRI